MQNSAADRLKAVRDRIVEACHRIARPLDAVTLLAVTKTRPASALLELYNLGLRSFGENRVLEAAEKQDSLPLDIEWHMIGHLQSNKAKNCLGFSWLHSLDRMEAAQSLEKAFAEKGQILKVLLEVNTGGEANKNGARNLDDLTRLAERVVSLPHLELRGLMTMAPFSPDESLVRPCFSLLRQWRDRMASTFPDQDWTTLSMGMSNDFEWAIQEGSTLVRIGTALFEGFR